MILARPDRGPNDRPIARDEISVGGWFISQRWTRFAFSSRGPGVLDPDDKVTLIAAVSPDTRGAAVAALGVTAPFASTPLDTRGWRHTAGALPERLTLRELPGAAPSVEGLYLPPIGGSPPADHWSAGLYEIDLLLGWRVATVTVAIPGSPAVGQSQPWSPRSWINGAAQPRVDNVTDGAFAIDSTGVARPVLTATSVSRTEPGAWLSSPTSARPEVARGPVPLLGVVLERGRIVRAALTPLIPSIPRALVTASVKRAPSLGGPVSAYGRLGRSVAYFDPPIGDLWPAGAYRLDLVWNDGRQDRFEDRQLELLPSSEDPFAPFLAAARAASAYVGERNVIAGPTNAGDDPRGRVVRAPAFVWQQSSIAHGAGPSPRSCNGAHRVESDERVLALTHDRRVAPSIEIRRLGRLGIWARVPLAEAPDAIEGVMLFAPRAGLNWLPGRYDVTLTFPAPGDGARRVERVFFCVAAGTPTDLGPTGASTLIRPSGASIDR
jgi:hypothetical protein